MNARIPPLLKLYALTSLVISLVNLPAPAADAPLTAKWIWWPQSEAQPYNQTIVAQKTFELDAFAAATLRVTADTFYRLYVNGAWVNDGPCRSWPEHFQYDVLDLTPYLRKGQNQIQVLARYYGVGDFHHVPRQPGLLAQLEVAGAGGGRTVVQTDASWDTAQQNAVIANTPKVSIQMEPAEWYDARLEQDLVFTKAAVVCEAAAGPWKNLNPRDVALLTRQPFALRTFLGAKIVKSDALNFCLPAARLLYPGLIEANHTVSLACGMATILSLREPATVTVQAEGFKFAIDGQRGKDGRFELSAGSHLLLVLAADVTSHNKEKTLRLLNPGALKLQNPLEPTKENPWCFLRFPEYTFATNDLVWISFRDENKEIAGKVHGFEKLSEELLRDVKDQPGLVEKLKSRAEQIPSERMFVRDSVWQTWERKVVGEATSLIENPAALMHDTPAATTVHPSPNGDSELLYDLGEQNCGYYNFELMAEPGVTVDIVGVEYIAPDGRIQWSGGNRNGLRYVTRAGLNRFTSLKRRSGRYLFITLRDFKAPVAIRHLNLIESTYPVNAIGSFACSDARLDRIWQISARTLKLCMEDTLTDCPLYEQTHWVGDARNESLFAYTVFGATDIGARCARQTAQSLERYPIVGCQVPSGWDCLLPAWSFLWTISTWDYFWFTGHRDFLRELHPAVIKNLKGAEAMVDPQGLFSAPLWNLFDWTPIDQGQKAVLHNNMFLVGAIDAALKSETEIGCDQHGEWLRNLRARLVQGANRLWDKSKNAYPDSIRGDGSISPSTSQHTSFLSALYDIVEPANLEHVKRNILDPPAKMVRVGSPFAAMYQYEALEKLGLEAEILKLIYQNYLPMLEADATTVWESFPSGTTGGGTWPTRSHCHAWSSAPLYFLNRITLGLRPTAAGWATATVSPHPGELSWARGTTATPHGPIQVAWRMKDNTLDITCTAPAAVKVQFASNAALKGKSVTFNGKQVQ